MKKVLAVILGGGKGTRLFPLTKDRSKPAVPFFGKYRIIDFPLSNCLNSELRKIFVLTQYASMSLNNHLARTYALDPFSEGFVNVLAAEQTLESPEWYQGTADAVRQNLKHFAPHDPDHVLILSGDQLYRMDYRKLLAFHKDQGADITVMALPVEEEKASAFGLLKVDAENRIAEFKEKPRGEALRSMSIEDEILRRNGIEPAGKKYLASMGIYLFNYPTLEKLVEDTSRVDFGKEIIPDSIPRHRVAAYVFDGYWEDIGTIGSFYQAHMDLTEPEAPFEFYLPHAPIFTHARYLPPSKIFECSVRESILSDGCIAAGSDIVHSVIGVRSIIRRGSKIERSIVMGADHYVTAEERKQDLERGRLALGIGRNCTIRKAIIDKNARIGDDVKILNE
ncbi:MAG: glucose-1-phosphate adenylyltransferase, partial [Acidobacteria bacterium]|nr:glucose-1-phosphate adenylyltransferase [Acidobacteriota bacterium]